MGKQYSLNQLNFLKENAPKMPFHELTILFNSVFNENRDINALRGTCYRYGIEGYSKYKVSNRETLPQEIKVDATLEGYKIRYSIIKR